MSHKMYVRNTNRSSVYVKGYAKTKILSSTLLLRLQATLHTLPL